jgi:hypothetical protein
MKDEYDFSKAQRGKFFRADATLQLPVYLDEENRAFVEKIAARHKKDVSTVVNELLRNDRDLASLVD